MKKTQIIKELQLEISKNSHVKNVRIEVGWEENSLKLQGEFKSYFQKQVVISIVNKIRSHWNFGVRDLTKVH